MTKEYEVHLMIRAQIKFESMAKVGKFWDTMMEIAVRR